MMVARSCLRWGVWCMQSARSIESTLRELAQLSQMFSAQVMHQAEQIEQLYSQACPTAEHMHPAKHSCQLRSNCSVWTPACLSVQESILKAGAAALVDAAQAVLGSRMSAHRDLDIQRGASSCCAVQAVKATVYTEKGNVSLGRAIRASGSASQLLIWFIIFFATAILFFDWFHS